MKQMKNFNDYNFNYIDEILVEKYKSKSKQKYFSNKELRLLEFENVIAQPIKRTGLVEYKGGILDKNLNNIEYANLYPDRLISSYPFDENEIVYDDKEVVFAGVFWPHWGHFIVEHVGRLYHFLNETKTNDLPIIYLNLVPFEGNFLEFFKLLGIDTNRLIWVDKPTKFKKIYIPETSVMVDNFYTKEYKQIFDTVINNPNIPNCSYKKVFHSTRNFFKDPEKNFGSIKKIETMFEKDGYKIISPEKLSLKEQIGIMKNCEEFATIGGTLSHNILFAKDKIKTTIINKLSILNYYQFLIDEVKNTKSLFVDCHLSLFPMEQGLGIFYFYISDKLKQYAKDNNIKIDKEDLSELNDFFENYKLTYLKRKKHIPKEEYNKFKTYLFYIKQIKNPFLKLKICFYSLILCTPFLRMLLEQIKPHTDKIKRKIRLLKLAFEISFHP